MPAPLTVGDLTAADMIVLRDLVRFGILTGDQVARRLRSNPRLPFLHTDRPTGRTARRIARLADGGWLARWPDLIHNTTVFSATPAAASLARTGLRLTRPSLEHLRHDIAVVDLADFLLAHEPAAEWRTEREIGRVLRGTHASRAAPDFAAPGAGHKPDGLLLVPGRCLAIELEHSDKGDQRYAGICRWFAVTGRVDGVRWYVDDDRIIDRLKRVSAQHGFADDVDFTYAPFPPGVVMRSWVQR